MIRQRRSTRRSPPRSSLLGSSSRRSGHFRCTRAGSRNVWTWRCPLMRWRPSGGSSETNGTPAASCPMPSPFPTATLPRRHPGPTPCRRASASIGRCTPAGRRGSPSRTASSAAAAGSSPRAGCRCPPRRHGRARRSTGDRWRPTARSLSVADAAPTWSPTPCRWRSGIRRPTSTASADAGARYAPGTCTGCAQPAATSRYPARLPSAWCESPATATLERGSTSRSTPSARRLRGEQRGWSMRSRPPFAASPSTCETRPRCESLVERRTAALPHPPEVCRRIAGTTSSHVACGKCSCPVCSRASSSAPGISFASASAWPYGNKGSSFP
jgi:hypothetical protein